VLSARVRDFDFENLLLTVIGKGDKQRIVPFSFELRKQLIRFAKIKERDDVPGECSRPATAGSGTSGTRSAATTCCSGGWVCRNQGSTGSGIPLQRST
jgi:integrase/recombinase XerD